MSAIPKVKGQEVVTSESIIDHGDEGVASGASADVAIPKHGDRLFSLMEEACNFLDDPRFLELSLEDTRAAVLDGLGAKHEAALMLGAMRMQVKENGFAGWFDSGYGYTDMEPIMHLLQQGKERFGLQGCKDLLPLLWDTFYALNELPENRKGSDWWGEDRDPREFEHIGVVYGASDSEIRDIFKESMASEFREIDTAYRELDEDRVLKAYDAIVESARRPRKVTFVPVAVEA